MSIITLFDYKTAHIFILIKIELYIMKHILTALLALSLFGCGGDSSSDNKAVVNHVTTPEKTVNLDGISLKSTIYPDKINDYSNRDHLKVVFSTDNITDGSETISCNWMIDNITVSNDCEYQLKENEHLSPIIVSAQLNYKEQVTDPFIKTFTKAFPIQQVENSYSKVTLLNTGQIIEWNHILDGEYAYQAERRFEKIPSIDNHQFIAIYAHANAFSGIKNNGNFYLWGPKIKDNVDLIDAINAEGVKKVTSANNYFSILTNTGNVYIIGSTKGTTKKLTIDNGIDMLTSESSTIIQTEEDKACLIEDSGKISCSDIQGDIKNLVELKYDYKGNYALLTDQGNLYRWGKLAKAQGELVSQNVENIIANDSAFAFLRLDGTVGAWGSRTQGGEFIYDYYSFEQTYFKASKKCVPVKNDEPDYDSSDIYDPDYEPAYDPICGRGYEQVSIPAYYSPEKKHSEHKLDTELTNVKKIVGASGSFAALTLDGDVITWGTIFSGGNIYSDKVNHANELTNIVDIKTNTNGYSTIRQDGDITSWQGIWDIAAEIQFGEYIKYYYYDQNRPSHVGFSDAFIKASPDSVTSFTSNEGAYLLTEEAKREPSPHFILNSWGFKELGAGLTNIKLPGKVDKVFSHKTGFTIYTDQGHIYNIDVPNEIAVIKKIETTI